MIFKKISNMSSANPECDTAGLVANEVASASVTVEGPNRGDARVPIPNSNVVETDVFR